MNLTRRTFFKVTAVGAATLAGTAKAEAAPELTVAEDARGVLVDTTKCVGCRACEAACAEANGLPALTDNEAIFDAPRVTAPQTFTVVNRYPVGPGGERFIKRQCMHCVDAACAAACPVRALQ
jgi:Fe-S-cluster-containing dehydrogenase component